jgi:hypothetical protein
MSLQSRLEVTAFQVAEKFENGILAVQMADWNSKWPVDLDTTVVENRTVSNWLVQSKTVELDISGTGDSDDVQAVIQVVARTLEAAIAAESAGRITLAQATDIENAWVSAWS